MANRKTSSIDRLRTQVWATAVLVAAGSLSPADLEENLKEKRRKKEGVEGDYKDASGIWWRYLGGRARPFRTWEPLPKTVWVDECEESFPGTASWFYSPIWYLMEEVEFLPSQILKCVQLLPERLKEDLLGHGVADTKSGLMLAELGMTVPFQIATEISVWSLGAMACVMRRAELSGQSPLVRRAGVGILWILDQLGPTAATSLRPLLCELRRVVSDMLDKYVYPLSGPMECPVVAKDFERFSCEVQRWHAIDEAFMSDDYESVDRLMALNWFELSAALSSRS